MPIIKRRIERGKICDPALYIDAINSICPYRFVSYEECQKWAKKKKIKTEKEYNKTKRPYSIPSSPDFTYKDHGWTGWKKFLGTEFVSYEECQKWAREKKIKSSAEYDKMTKPENTPANPDVVYKDEGWPGWGDFLGTNNCRNTKFVSYEECQKWARKKKIKTKKEYSKTKRPNDIPSSPSRTYKDEGWPGWGDFLGTNNYRNTRFVSYEECQKWAMKKKIKTQQEYRETKRPNDIPSSPFFTYRLDGWPGWKKFLGTKKLRISLNKIHKSTSYVSYEECQKWAREKKIKSSAEYDKMTKPENTPANPYRVYKNKGWTNWYDFLGKKKKCLN